MLDKIPNLRKTKERSTSLTSSLPLFWGARKILTALNQRNYLKPIASFL
jgi:hypothetical protein